MAIEGKMQAVSRRETPEGEKIGVSRDRRRIDKQKIVKTGVSNYHFFLLLSNALQDILTCLTASYILPNLSTSKPP